MLKMGYPSLITRLDRCAQSHSKIGYSGATRGTKIIDILTWKAKGIIYYV